MLNIIRTIRIQAPKDGVTRQPRFLFGVGKGSPITEKVQRLNGYGLERYNDLDSSRYSLFPSEKMFEIRFYVPITIVHFIEFLGPVTQVGF